MHNFEIIRYLQNTKVSLKKYLNHALQKNHFYRANVHAKLIVLKIT